MCRFERRFFSTIIIIIMTTLSRLTNAGRIHCLRAVLISLKQIASFSPSMSRSNSSVLQDRNRCRTTREQFNGKKAVACSAEVMSYLEVLQVQLHVLQQLQDPVFQNIKEPFQSIKLFIHQLRNTRNEEPG